mmetsp:Transcript_12512/g.14333  ORF Transcript_12512/g.14333 Transcript_12512/m.14333 type:complete len:120 (-) Transcript_12512:369-728(-)
MLCKGRFSKSYLIPQLDKVITKIRIKSEIKCLAKCRMVGVRTLRLLGYGVDVSDGIPALTVRAYFESVRLGYIQKSKLDKMGRLCQKKEQRSMEIGESKIVTNAMTTTVHQRWITEPTL